MKCYLLLRENVENGPFTLEEIMKKNLLPTDLVWVEGSSQSWRFPYEIHALAPYVQSSGQKENETFSENDMDTQTIKRVFVALPPQPNSVEPKVFDEESLAEPVEETAGIVTPLEELKANLEAHHKNQTFKFRKHKMPSGAGWMAAVFIGVLISAVMIKKMVDAMEERSTTLASAAMPVTGLPQQGSEGDDKTYQNALSTELVPMDSTVVEKTKKTPKKVAIKKLVKLTASDYKKGIFGGINHLKLQVENKSDQILDKVSIEVKYLKPNGDVIAKENHYVLAVAPKSTKTLEVPPSNRGVEFKYRITHIKSHEAKAPMRDL